VIKGLELHDATLVSVDFAWGIGVCNLWLEHGQQGSCVLTFAGVSNITLPRLQPWGRSSSINSARKIEDNRYEIEMQSGDLLTIDANSASLRRSYESHS
jgi:hypothetical protein